MHTRQVRFESGSHSEAMNNECGNNVVTLSNPQLTSDVFNTSTKWQLEPSVAHIFRNMQFCVRYVPESVMWWEILITRTSLLTHYLSTHFVAFFPENVHTLVNAIDNRFKCIVQSLFRCFDRNHEHFFFFYSIYRAIWNTCHWSDWFEYEYRVHSATYRLCHIVVIFWLEFSLYRLHHCAHIVVVFLDLFGSFRFCR